jgi:hypothetical protein
MAAASSTLTPAYIEHVLDAPPQRLSVAWDRWNNLKNRPGKGYFSFESADAMLAWYSARAQKCCYEILRTTKPIAVGFDIDGTFAKQKHAVVLEREKLSRESDAFLAAVVERIGDAFPQLRGAAYLPSTSNRPGEKLSFHLKFPGFYLRDMAERDAFTREIRCRLASLLPLVDPSVYSANKQMRMSFSHKLGDSSRPLLPAGFAAGDAPDMAAVLEHMWTTVPADAVPFYPDGVAAQQPPPTERATRGPKRKLAGDAAPAPTSPASRQAASRGYTMSRETFTARYGLSFDAYHAQVLAMLGDGDGDGEALLPAGDRVGAKIYWRTRRPHKCPRGETHESNSFLTRLESDGAVFRACLAERCKQADAHLDWRIIGLLGASTDRWCADEQPPRDELRPWPLPRHWYFYAPLARRKLGADVRCIASREVKDFDPESKSTEGVFHKFLVEYTHAAGHAVREELGVSLYRGRLFRRIGPEQYLQGLEHAYKLEVDGPGVYDHERLEWWWTETWDVNALEARRGEEALWQPPHSWVVPGMSCWYPWLDLSAAVKVATAAGVRLI